MELGLSDKKKTRVNTGGTRFTNEDPQNNLKIFDINKYISILYGMMLNVSLSSGEIMLFCKSTDEYSTRILNDKKYPKIPGAKPWSGNRPLMRYLISYMHSVMPIITTNTCPLAAYQNAFSNATNHELLKNISEKIITKINEMKTKPNYDIELQSVSENVYQNDSKTDDHIAPEDKTDDNIVPVDMHKESNENTAEFSKDLKHLSKSIEDIIAIKLDKNEELNRNNSIIKNFF